MTVTLAPDVRRHLIALYGEAAAATALARLADLLARYRGRIPAPPRGDLSERDAVLITYGDMVSAAGRPPLATLGQFLARHAAGSISTVHLLPFFPSSSDDGFSVVDYRAVDPALGGWADIAAIGAHFRLMFDAVINHVSAESAWFEGFRQDDPRYRDFFVVAEPDEDLTEVFRPRALPLLLPVETSQGDCHVWTTFSADQIDLNYRNPEVLLEIVDVLLFYASQGAEFIRLDAIAFLWKEPGTTCVHRPETHRVIQLIRAVLAAAAPHVRLITETNVPHRDNISYFGDGTNEAHLVYNFALPPLVLHAFHTEDAAALTGWAGASLELPSRQTAFFNFLASHDGIGVTPALDLIGRAAVDEMGARVEALGGFVSYRHNPDGSQSPYELNVNFLDALGDPALSGESSAVQAKRFLAAEAIMLALRGLPGIYFHSLFGSHGWPEGARETGRHRTINRQKLALAALEAELADPASLRRLVFDGHRRLLQARGRTPAFHPQGDQAILALDPAVFAVLRGSPGGRNAALCLHHVARGGRTLDLDLRPLGLAAGRELVDLVSGARFRARTDGTLRLELEPYDVRWLAEAPA